MGEIIADIVNIACALIAYVVIFAPRGGWRAWMQRRGQKHGK